MKVDECFQSAAFIISSIDAPLNKAHDAAWARVEWAFTLSSGFFADAYAALTILTSQPEIVRTLTGLHLLLCP